MMQVAEVTGLGQPLKITDRSIPDCPPEGLLLKTLYAGVCHSDIHLKEDDAHRQALENNGYSFEGMVMGHEICGQIETIGKEVPSDCSLRIGDKVMVFAWRGCQQCESCSAGENNLCEENQGSTTEIGQGIHIGGYAEFVPVPEYNLVVKVPVSVPPHIACLLPCSAVTAYNAISKARPSLDLAVRTRGVANLLLIGMGGVGMWAVILIKNIFCDKNVKVICADLAKEKLDCAAELGADDIVQWETSTSITDLVTATTVSGYNKIDAAIDFVGLPKTVEVAFESLHHGGGIVVVGLVGASEEFPLPMGKMISKAVSIQGLRTSGRSQFKEFIDLFGVQNANIYPPITYCKLDELNSIHEKLKKGEIVGRAVIKYI